MGKVLAVVAVLVTLALLVSPASAVSLAIGDTLAKFQDYSVLYAGPGNPLYPAGTAIGFPAGTPNPNPPPNFFPTSSIFLGDEQKTIFRVTTIFDNNGDPEFDTSSATEITGTLTGLVVVNVQYFGTIAVVDFGPVTAIPEQVNVWEDSSKDFNADPAGAGKLKDALPAASVVIPANGAPYQWGVGNTFPTVTDGSLWLDGTLVDLWTLSYVDGVMFDTVPGLGSVAFTPGEIMREWFDIGSGTGHGFAYVDVTPDTDGSFDASVIQGWVKDQFGNSTIADLTMEFDLTTPVFNSLTGNWQGVGSYQGPGYWTVQSQDPVSFGVVIPEPMTLTLLGLGVAGLFARRRKK